MLSAPVYAAASIVLLTLWSPASAVFVAVVDIVQAPGTVGAKRTFHELPPSQNAGREMTAPPGPVNVAVTWTSAKGSV